ncbi:MAG TPA: ABC transporter ATP-binding protein [Nostocaceae cyanobacterium]|nr:ABC transporter ATP-binding protein [Nostocaceae cyanobacterium]
MKSGSITDIFDLARSQKGKLIASSIFACFSTALGLVPFILTYLIVVELFNPPVEQNYIWTLAIISLIAIISRWVILGIGASLSHIAAYNILYDIRVTLAQKLGTLPLGYLDDHQTGELKKVMNEDVEQLEMFIAHGIPEIVGLLATFLLTAGYLFTVDWRMALAAIALVPIAILTQTFMFQGIEPLLQAYYASLDKMNNTIIEYVQGMAVVKAFTQTTESFTKYQNSVTEYQKFEEQWSLRSLLPWTLFTVILSANIAVILPVGVWLLSKQEITIPTLILFLLLGVGIGVPFLRFVEAIYNYVQLQQSTQRIYAIINEPPLTETEIVNIPQDLTIEFKDVSFGYREKQVLQNINFIAPPNTITALVGHSGSGKTTITRLIARFWDVQQGAITLGEVNIKNLKLEDLMSKIAFVFQDVVLFNDTIIENIRVGKPNATIEEVIAAAKAARCHEFISSFPDGYQTIIGERGAKLSGGQKQRISIARAILKDAPIIILDEATAFIDPENEVQIQAAIGELIQHKTLLIIAHRLSTIVEADQIILMHQGQIIGQGRHEELLQNSDLYKQMWQSHIAAQNWTFAGNQFVGTR